MRPNTAVKLLVAPCQPSLSFSLLRMALIKSTCSCCSGLRPLAFAGQFDTPLVPWTNFADKAPGVRLLAALAIQFCAVLVGELDEVIVVDLADAAVVAAVAASHAVGLDGMIALGPVAHVDIVDVLLDDVIAAKPDEMIPVAHLVLHLGLARLARANPDGSAVPVAAQQCQFRRASPS